MSTPPRSRRLATLHEETPMAPGNEDAEDPREMTMAEIAREAGRTLRVYPHPGRAVRQVVLRDTSGDHGAQFEAAQLEDDGTLRITGHDHGPGVSEVFGDEISSYEWVYLVAPGRAGNLLRLLGGQDGDDVLAILAAYYQRNGGVISHMLKSPEVASDFSNWHS
jgi:hypothetical protein